MTQVLQGGVSLRVDVELEPFSIGFGNVVSSSPVYKYWRATYRNICYGGGLYWLFYGKYDGNLYWKTSVDGIAWSGERSISGIGGPVHYIDVCAWNNIVHILYRDRSGNNWNIPYRGGTLRPDGNIDWSPVWQVLTSMSASANVIAGISIRTDSDGYPFLVYEFSTLQGQWWNTYAGKSATNNGIWIWGTGYWIFAGAAGSVNRSQGVYADDGASGGVSLVSYNDAKMYLLVDYMGQLRGVPFDGSTWSCYGNSNYPYQYGSWETLANGNHVNFNGVTDELDNVHIVTQDRSRADKQISYIVRPATGQITSLVIDSEPAGNISPASICYDAISQSVRIVYCKAGQVKCKRITRGGEVTEHALFDIATIAQISAIPYAVASGPYALTGFTFVGSWADPYTQYGWVIM